MVAVIKASVVDALRARYAEAKDKDIYEKYHVLTTHFVRATHGVNTF